MKCKVVGMSLIVVFSDVCGVNKPVKIKSISAPIMKAQSASIPNQPSAKQKRNAEKRVKKDDKKYERTELANLKQQHKDAIKIIRKDIPLTNAELKEVNQAYKNHIKNNTQDSADGFNGTVDWYRGKYTIGKDSEAHLKLEKYLQGKAQINQIKKELPLSKRRMIKNTGAKVINFFKRDKKLEPSSGFIKAE